MHFINTQLSINSKSIKNLGMLCSLDGISNYHNITCENVDILKVV